MSDLIERMTAERDRHVIGYPGPRRNVAELIDQAITALSEAEQRVKDARREALEEAARLAFAPLSNLEADRFIFNGVTATNKKGQDLFLSVADLEAELCSRASAIRALQSEER
ncbi:MAG: hypothetical protein AAGD15_01555 [Agrobacterium cavarae]|uniref:hypothetical protein n=1 Tax=Agrobacterium cavarae TaxID=2528239 RepID=UPI0031A7B14B